MKERPILFSAPMVRAILDGSKTQTRRVVKPAPPAGTDWVGTYHHPNPRPHFHAMQHGEFLDWCQPCPYGEVGDRLWVRETFCPVYPQDPSYNGGEPIEYDYAATYQHGDRLGDSLGVKKVWKPSIHMPRVASRILLEVTGVRVERLQDISEADAIAEGIENNPRLDPAGRCHWRVYGKPSTGTNVPEASYQSLWEDINDPGSWDTNPWVWVIEFKRTTP